MIAAPTPSALTLDPTQAALAPDALTDGVIHNGRYTVQNTRTGEHRTFSVKTQKDNARFAPGKRIVALLTGPNNEDDYKGFGFVDGSGRSIAVWSSKRGTTGKRSHFEWYANMLVDLICGGTEWAARGYVVLVERTCRVCNRTLTEPESIRSGIGPICAGRGS